MIGLRKTAHRLITPSRALAALLAAALLLAGCSAFFSVNVLKGLDKVSAPSASDYQGAGGLDKLAHDLSSPAIVNALKSDPAATASIESYLQTTYLSTPLTTPEQQQAAVLYSSLVLQTTSGDELVNNVASIVVSGTGSGKTVQEILQNIVPSDVAADPVAFAAMVNGLLAANVQYMALGNSIPTYGVPPGVNLGDVTQKAAVAYTMQCVVDAVIASGVPDTPTAISEMFALTNNQPNSIATVTVPDPFSPAPGWLTNIFDAAGVNMPS